MQGKYALNDEQMINHKNCKIAVFLRTTLILTQTRASRKSEK